MKGVFCEKLGTPDDLVVREVEDPGPPGAGEVSVTLEARGISFADLLLIAGGYQNKPELPFVLGGEAAGHIAEVGPGVTGLEVGDAVLAHAGCVERVVTRAEDVTALHAGADLEAAASFRNNYATALYALQRGRLQAGETLLVHGAAGGVGTAAVDIGKLMGARIIATAGTDEKLAVVGGMGADHLINYTDGFREQVKALTGGRGADVIYDPVGGDVFDESMRCVAPFGRILILGFTSGRVALAKTNHLLIKDAEAIGLRIDAMLRDDPVRAERNDRVLRGWLASARIHPYVSHRVPLSRAPDALRLIADRQVIGKVVVVND